MKKFGFLLVLLFLFCSQIFPRQLEMQTAVAVMELKALSHTSNQEAEAITEIIRNELIRSEFINVIESSQSEVFYAEMEFQNNFSNERLIELGKLVESDFFILGSVGKLQNKIVISLRLISADTAENIYAETLYTNNKDFFKDILYFTDMLSKIILEFTLGNTLNNIQNLIDRGDFLEADKKLLIFQKRYGNTLKSNHLRENINIGLVEIYNARALEFYQEKEFQQALLWSKRSLKINPDNKNNQLLYQKILIKQKQFLQKKEKKIMRRIQRKIFFRQYQEADNLYKNHLDSREPDYYSQEFFSLNDKINKARARIAYKKARNLASLERSSFLTMNQSIYAKKVLNLNKAKDKMVEALRLEPEKRLYQKYLHRINRKIDKTQDDFNKRSKMKSLLSPAQRNHYFQIGGGYCLLRIPGIDLINQADGYFQGFRFDASYQNMIINQFTLKLITASILNLGNDTKEISNNRFQNQLTFFSQSAAFNFGLGLSFFDITAGPNLEISAVHTKNLQTVEITEADDRISQFNYKHQNFEMNFGTGFNLRFDFHFPSGIFLNCGWECMLNFTFHDNVLINNRLFLGGGYGF